MFILIHILQFVINRFDYGPFPKKSLIRHTHQRVLHLILQLDYQLGAIDKEFAEQVFTDVFSVSDDSAIQLLGKTLLFERVAVFHVARCNM